VFFNSLGDYDSKKCEQLNCIWNFIVQTIKSSHTVEASSNNFPEGCHHFQLHSSCKIRQSTITSTVFWDKYMRSRAQSLVILYLSQTQSSRSETLPKTRFQFGSKLHNMGKIKTDASPYAGWEGKPVLNSYLGALQVRNIWDKTDLKNESEFDGQLNSLVSHFSSATHI